MDKGTTMDVATRSSEVLAQLLGTKACTVAEFAKEHGISRSQAYLEIRDGRLVARKVGTRTLITCEDAAIWRQNLPTL